MSGTVEPGSLLHRYEAGEHEAVWADMMALGADVGKTLHFDNAWAVAHRLTNAFSKKIENHSAAVALGYFAYNLIKIRRTLRVTPAMAAGVTDRLWEVSDLVALIEPQERGLERAA